MDCQLSTETLVDSSNLNPLPEIDLETPLSNSSPNIVLAPNSISSHFCGKPARKYALNRTLNLEDCSEFERGHVSEIPVTKPSDASNCSTFYDNNYALNFWKFTKGSLLNKKCVTMLDIARYAANLPYMTRESSVQCKDKSKDYLDDATMELVRHSLFQLSSIDGMATGGPPSSITFHSAVTARRISVSGKVNLLLHWSPENMIPDTWITEDELCHNFEKTIPVSQLPHEALQLPVMDVLGSAGILSHPGKRKRK